MYHQHISDILLRIAIDDISSTCVNMWFKFMFIDWILWDDVYMETNYLYHKDKGLPSVTIAIHEFVDHDTWSLHLALHVNGVLVGTASAKPGNSKYDQETVVAALHCLKNDYFRAIGSPMRYENGKLIFLKPDNGMALRKGIQIQTNRQKKSYSMALSRNVPQKLFA